MLAGAAYDRLSELRSQADLYFDTGDCIKAGNLGVPLKPEPVWQGLRELDCTASVLGNRETHILDSAFQAKLQGAAHPILCANLRRKDGSRPLPGTLPLALKGFKIGLIGVMVPMVTERMATKAASAFFWDPPIPTAKSLAEELRPQVDLLIALTHIGFRQDVELATECPLFDVILGGHSHTILETPTFIGRTAICQGGSHVKYAGIYEWQPEKGLTGGLVELAWPRRE